MILFLNINSKPIEVMREDTLVIDCKLIGSFCNFTGRLLLEGLTDMYGTPVSLLVNHPGKLLFDFKQENEVCFDAIISEWEKIILPRLFNESALDGQYYEFQMPYEYTEWLIQHIDGIFSEAGKKLKREGNILHFSASKLQRNVVNKVMDMLEYNIQHSDENFEWFTLSDGRIQKDSAFVNVVEEKCGCIRFIDLEAYNLFNDSQTISEIINESELVDGTYEEEPERQELEDIEYSESESELTEKTTEEETYCKARAEFKRGIPNILTFNANGVVFDMMPVEGGTFKMGATREQSSDAWDTEMPKHRVTLSSYYIGELEVTQALWQAVMGTNPSQKQGYNLPVDRVSWNDCQNFITKLNELCSDQLGEKHFALPTESQWEFAARGGGKSRGYKYSGSNYLDDVAWFEDNSDGVLHAVGMKSPNELGLYDMNGNINEWCSDLFAYYDKHRKVNPTGPSTDDIIVHVIRGGNINNDATQCRVSSRNSTHPDCRNSCLGFRLALCNNL